MRAGRARRAGGRGARLAAGAGIALATASILMLRLPAGAQEASDVGALSGTLKRVKEARAITLGYRESSLSRCVVGAVLAHRKTKSGGSAWPRTTVNSRRPI